MTKSWKYLLDCVNPNGFLHATDRGFDVFELLGNS